MSRRVLACAVGVALAAPLALALAPSPPADAGARGSSQCQRLQGRDLAPARFVKLVNRRSGLYGCMLPRGPVRRVTAGGEDGESDRSNDLKQVAGRIVVVDESYTNQYAFSVATRVYDLRGGLSYTVAERCMVKAAFPCFAASERSAAATFVTPAGRAVALVVDDAFGAIAQPASVVAFSTLGRGRVLDSGAIGAIPPASLRLTGNLASWTNAGVARSASITAG